MDSNIIIAISLVVVAFVVLFVMTYNEKKKKKTNVYNTTENLATVSSNVSKKSNNFKIEITNIRYPYLIDNMEHNHLAKAYEVIYDTFGFLDYPKKSSDELMQKEWHSWQMAILLRYLSKKAVFIKPNAKEMIPEEIRKIPKQALKMELNLLVNRFYKEVDIHKSKEALCDELHWTARDVSIVLMCIINENRS